MIGFNYRMTNIQAGMGLAQLERIDQFVEMRRQNANSYSSRLKELPGHLRHELTVLFQPGFPVEGFPNLTIHLAPGDNE